MMNTSRLQIFALAAYLIAAVSGATVGFDCNAIPETCNNMCYAGDRGVYNEMHFDPDANNRRPRRQAAGCYPNPNRCSTNPPTPQRVTTHGTGNNGWYDNTGATTRCVSRAECNSQGGSLSAFYQSFGRVDGTMVDVVVYNFAGPPYCGNNPPAPDPDFQTGNPPPNRRDLDGFSTGGRPPIRRADFYEYRTSSNLTVLSITGPLEIGSDIFIPNNDWQNNSKVRARLARRQDEDEDCNGTQAQTDAASLLENDELGTTDKIVEQL